MKNKTIFLCASMSFYRELVEIEKKLVAKGFMVNIPVSAQRMKETGDFEVYHFKNIFTPHQKAGFINRNFRKIAEGHAILVVNNTKSGVHGYIGPNVLMEIGLAFYLKKNIYILNPIDANASYKEELLAFGVTVINGNLDTIRK